jgi:hypothetical protein
MGEQVLLYLWTANPGGQAWVDSLARVYSRTGFIRGLSAAEEDGQASWWALERTWVGPAPNQGGRQAFEELFADGKTGAAMSSSSEEFVGRALLVRGLAAARLTAGEVGTHLFCPEHAGVVPVQVHAWPIADNGDPLTLLLGQLKRRRQWLEALSRGETIPTDDPLRLAPVVRLYNEGRGWIDVRTGLVGEMSLPNVPALVLAGLLLPEEVCTVWP